MLFSINEIDFNEIDFNEIVDPCLYNFPSSTRNLDKDLSMSTYDNFLNMLHKRSVYLSNQ